MRSGFSLLLLLSSGCASHGTILTLLPPEDGDAVGGVVFNSENGTEESLFDQVGQSGNTKLKAGSQSISDAKIAELLSILPFPPKPKYFTLVFPYQVEISQEARGILAEMRAELASRPGAEIAIEGYTDSDGPEELNDQVSLARAMAVADELRSFGFSVDSENVVGLGERAANERNGDNVVDQMFRRVDVTIR